MAIKDIIVPAFIGTVTIKWIITRGLTSAGTIPQFVAAMQPMQKPNPKPESVPVAY